MHKIRGREPRMIRRKVFLEITTNGVSTMVFVQREHKEHLAEKEMSNTLNTALKTFLGKSTCVLAGKTCANRN